MKNYSKYLYLAVAVMMTAFSACSGNSGDEPGTGGGDETGALVLRTSATVIEANGQDAAVFTVMKGNADVTGKATIYKASTAYNNTSFSSTAEGSFQFFASYNGEISEKITIQAVSGIPSLPADPNASAFEGFKHRALAVQGTSTGCAYCPYMISGMNIFAATERAASTVFVAVHTNINETDPMTSDASLAVISAAGMNSFPAMVINMDKSMSIGSNYPQQISNNISTNVRLVLEDPAACGISAAVSGTEASGKIKVQAKIKVGADADYRIAAWLLEDGIEHAQANSTDVVLDSPMIHNKALRAASTTSPVSGALLGGRTGWTKGEQADFFCEFNIAKAGIKNLSKCHVVIVVSKPNSDNRFIVDNVIDCPINRSVAFEYE